MKMVAEVATEYTVGERFIPRDYMSYLLLKSAKETTRTYDTPCRHAIQMILRIARKEAG